MIGVDYSEGMLGQAMEKEDRAAAADPVCLPGYAGTGTLRHRGCRHLHAGQSEPPARRFEDVADGVPAVSGNPRRPGGVFLFDMNTLYKHRELLGSQVYVYETDAVYCVWENALCARTTAPSRSRWICSSCVVQDGRYRRTRRSRSQSVPMCRSRCTASLEKHRISCAGCVSCGHRRAAASGQ